MGSISSIFSKQDNEQEVKKQLTDLETLISEIETEQKAQNTRITKLNEGKENIRKLLEGTRLSHDGNRRLEDENGELKKRKTILDNEMRKLGNENRELGDENRKLKQRNTELDNGNGKLTHENRELKRRNRDLQNEIDNLKHRLELASRKKPVQVYMYAPSMNERISTAVRSELQDILAQHLEATKEKKLETVPTFEAKMVPSNKLLVVLCINASRLGTDVEQALQNVACSRSVVVAVIHHKEIHALPPQASEKLLYGDKFRELRAIVDIAFLTNKGMYACDMNNRALERLTDFICEFDT